MPTEETRTCLPSKQQNGNKASMHTHQSTKTENKKNANKSLAVRQSKDRPAHIASSLSTVAFTIPGPDPTPTPAPTTPP